jgi:5S rRNA maturation endonuclease (ribonuclease M5)
MNLKQIKKMLNENAHLVFAELGMKCETFSDNIYSTCPVHEGSDNPRAFSFSPQKGIWKCWTRDCQSECGNDLFGLIAGALSAQEGRTVEFKEALAWACKILNVKQTYTRGTPSPVEELEDPFQQMINIMSTIPTPHEHKTVEMDVNIEIPSQYFVERNYNKRTMKHFGIGDCYSKCKLNERAIIPIHDESGKRLIGLIGRSTRDYRIPKFLFYPTGFDKRYCLYNYHRAIKKAIETSCLYIVEGQGDVWKLYEAGVHNAVSIFGKTVSSQQQQKLMSIPVTHLIILTDNDQAGRESKVQIKRDLGRMFKLTFPKLAHKDVGDMKVKDIKLNILSNLKGTY